MGLERYVVDAVLIEKRSPTEIARAHGISRRPGSLETGQKCPLQDSNLRPSA